MTQGRPERALPPSDRPAVWRKQAPAAIAPDCHEPGRDLSLAVCSAPGVVAAWGRILDILARAAPSQPGIPDLRRRLRAASEVDPVSA